MGLFVLILVSSLISFYIGYTFGKFKGAKDGIDYCFEQWEKNQLNNNWGSSTGRAHDLVPNKRNIGTGMVEGSWCTKSFMYVYICRFESYPQILFKFNDLRWILKRLWNGRKV